MCRRGRRHVKRVQARALKMVGIRRALLMITPVNGYGIESHRSQGEKRGEPDSTPIPIPTPTPMGQKEKGDANQRVQDICAKPRKILICDVGMDKEKTHYEESKAESRRQSMCRSLDVDNGAECARKGADHENA
jgi:hypothetical protein